jgi:hypothetical protein
MPSPWVRKLRPHSLEGSHLASRDGLGVAGCLKHIGKILGDHTSKHVNENVLEERRRRIRVRDITHHAEEIPSDKKSERPTGTAAV